MVVALSPPLEAARGAVCTAGYAPYHSTPGYTTDWTTRHADPGGLFVHMEAELLTWFPVTAVEVR